MQAHARRRGLRWPPTDRRRPATAGLSSPLPPFPSLPRLRHDLAFHPLTFQRTPGVPPDVRYGGHCLAVLRFDRGHHLLAKQSRIERLSAGHDAKCRALPGRADRQRPWPGVDDRPIAGHHLAGATRQWRHQPRQCRSRGARPIAGSPRVGRHGHLVGAAGLRWQGQRIRQCYGPRRHRPLHDLLGTQRPDTGPRAAHRLRNPRPGRLESETAGAAAADRGRTLRLQDRRQDRADDYFVHADPAGRQVSGRGHRGRGTGGIAAAPWRLAPDAGRLCRTAVARRRGAGIARHHAYRQAGHRRTPPHHAGGDQGRQGRVGFHPRCRRRSQRLRSATDRQGAGALRAGRGGAVCHDHAAGASPAVDHPCRRPWFGAGAQRGAVRAAASPGGAAAGGRRARGRCDRLGQARQPDHRAAPGRSGPPDGRHATHAERPARAHRARCAGRQRKPAHPHRTGTLGNGSVAGRRTAQRGVHHPSAAHLVQAGRARLPCQGPDRLQCRCGGRQADGLRVRQRQRRHRAHAAPASAAVHQHRTLSLRAGDTGSDHDPAVRPRWPPQRQHAAVAQYQCRSQHAAGSGRTGAVRLDGRFRPAPGAGRQARVLPGIRPPAQWPAGNHLAEPGTDFQPAQCAGRRRPHRTHGRRFPGRVRPHARRCQRHGGAAHRHCLRHPDLGHADQRSRQRNCCRQQRSLPAHRTTGRQSGRNRSLDGGTHLHRQTECRARASGQPAGHRRGRRGIARRFGGGAGRHHDVGHRDLVQENRRDHQRHRWHRIPDQYPGLECRRGSGACRRTGPRLCRGRFGSAHAGATFGWCCKGDQAPDRRFGEQGGTRRVAGASGRHHHERDRGQRAARHRHHGRNLRRVAGTIVRHRAGQPHRDADG